MIEKTKNDFYEHVKKLQLEITKKMHSIDKDLHEITDPWERLDFQNKPGGGGETRALTGKVFENAGVNTSCVFGAIDPNFSAKLQNDAKSENHNMWAAGISLIIHPQNPKVPTVHANFRMIFSGEKFWFGGGADLTPFYPYPEDFKHFHDVWKKACAPYHCYTEMKKECDIYFTNKHRGNEMRGVSGIFFDYFNSGNPQKDLEMVCDLSNHFIESYFPIVEKRFMESYTPEDEDFQLHRRGRYIEFNLLHDRGTMFGLKTNGRVDSILISLPKRAKFTYKYAPAVGSPHEKMMEYYKV